MKQKIKSYYCSLDNELKRIENFENDIEHELENYPNWSVQTFQIVKNNMLVVYNVEK